MKKFIEIDCQNLKDYYNRLDGNLYFHTTETELFEVVDGFSYEELKEGLASHQINIIWIAGPCLDTSIK